MTTTLPPPGADAPIRHPQAAPPGTVLPPHYKHCFGCGNEHEGGLHLQVTVGEGVSVDAEFVVTADHQGAPGLAHGGVIATAVDESLGYLLWLVGRPAVTGRLEVDYLKPVPVGSTLAIHAECYAVSGRKIYTRGTGTVAGSTVVRAAALYIAVSLEHFTDHGWRDAEATHGGETYNP